MSEEYCGNCRFWDGTETKMRYSGLGNCRRYPPVLDGLQLLQAKVNGYAKSGDEYACDSSSWWSTPCVAERDWCGEWKPRAHAVE